MTKEQARQERLLQREKIREFDKTWHTCVANGMEPVETLVKGAYIVFVGILMAIPYEKEWGLIMSFFGLNSMAVWTYMMQKMFVTENKKSCSIYEKLKYAPVSKKEIRWVRIEYLIKFLKIPFVVAMLAQLLGAWLINHEIGIANVVYPLLAQGVCPLALGVLMTYEL